MRLARPDRKPIVVVAENLARPASTVFAMTGRASLMLPAHATMERCRVTAARKRMSPGSRNRQKRWVGVGAIGVDEHLPPAGQKPELIELDQPSVL